MLTVTKGAVMSSVLHPAIVCDRLAILAGFRHGLYEALTARCDELFELADAVLCTDDAVKTLVDVSPWLRPDANTSPDRCFCHTFGCGRDEHRMIPGCGRT
jgi:hypothetical protein